MQLLLALDQIAGLLWVSLLVSAALIAFGVAVYATGELVARLSRRRPKVATLFRKAMRALLAQPQSDDR
jgi:MFS family permease